MDGPGLSELKGPGKSPRFNIHGKKPHPWLVWIGRNISDPRLVTPFDAVRSRKDFLQMQDIFAEAKKGPPSAGSKFSINQKFTSAKLFNCLSRNYEVFSTIIPNLNLISRILDISGNGYPTKKCHRI